MDLIYEQEASEKLEDSQETLKAQDSNASGTNAELNKKTEESFQKLEDEISKTYTAIESKASVWGASFSSFISNLNVAEVITETKKQVENLHIDDKLQETRKNISKNFDSIQKKIVSEERSQKSKNMLNLLSQKTNAYLDDLDKDLEEVENAAGAYVSKFGQFLKDTIAVERPDDADELIDEKDGALLFNVGGTGTSNSNFSANRTEAQLYTLHTSPELYLTNDSDAKFEEFKSHFNVESKTDDITELLKKNANLQKLSTQLVPAQVKYAEFWTRYFYMHQKILQQESNRKKLLNQKQSSAIKEDLDWDDDEDDENAKDESEESKKHENSASSSDGTYELNSINSSTIEVNKKTKETNDTTKKSVETKEEQEEEKEEEDDEDDDWE